MASELPREVVVAPGQMFSVDQKELNGPLGFCDHRHIAIEVNIDPVGKHEVLLHEMVHLACEKIKAAGLAKRQPSEQFVTFLSGALFPMLAASGLWNGVSPQEAMEWALEEDCDG